MEHPGDIETYVERNGVYSTVDIVDYVAGLTDQYAINYLKITLFQILRCNRATKRPLPFGNGLFV